LDYSYRDKFEYAGAAGGFIDKLGYPYCRGRIFNETETDNGQHNQVLDTFWASGAAFLIRSKLFHEVGGFDSSFFAHMEEIDLCWRLHSSGYKIACIPSSIVYHVGGGTLNKVNPRKTFLNFRNGTRLLIKNLPKKELIYVLPIRYLLDMAAAVYLTITQSYRHGFAVLKAYLDLFVFLSEDTKPTNRSKIPSYLIKEKNILFAFFIRGKKRFNQLNNTK